MAGHPRPNLIRSNQTSNTRERTYIALHENKGETPGKIGIPSVVSAVTQLYKADREGLSDKTSPTTKSVLAGVHALRKGDKIPPMPAPRRTEAKEYHRISKEVENAGVAQLKKEVEVATSDIERDAHSTNNEVGLQINPPPTRKSTKEYDDSFTQTPAKGGVKDPKAPSYKPKAPSDKQRKKSEFLEAKLQQQCINYARDSGVDGMIWDNDGYPDVMFWFGNILLGAVEFKSLNGIPTDEQIARIKELRKRFKNFDKFRVFRDYDCFKEWLNRRIQVKEELSKPKHESKPNVNSPRQLSLWSTQ